MKKIIIIFLFLVSLLVIACTQNNQAACTAEAKICPDGTAVGRTGTNCEFAPCPAPNASKCDYSNPDKSYLKKEVNCVINFMCMRDKEAFRDECGCGCKLKEGINENNLNENVTQSNQNSSLKQNSCTADSRKGEFCMELYQPVCGWFDPGKIQCIKYPCAQTFSNSCFACHNSNVLYWTEGECPK